MTIQDAVDQYLAKGGKVTAVPGFTGTKPLPPRVPALQSTEAVKKAKGKCRMAGWYTMSELALELDYVSTNSIRLLQAKGLIPDPCGKRGGKDVWRPEVVQEVVARVQAHRKTRKVKGIIMRQAIRTEAATARAIRAGAESYAKKQRDKLELAQEWKELDNAAP